MAGGDRFLDGGSECVGIGDRDDQSGRILVHGGIDELRHRHHIEGLGGAIVDRYTHIGGRLGDAVLDHRPERIRSLSMADDDDAGGLRLSGEHGACKYRCGSERLEHRFHDKSSRWMNLRAGRLLRARTAMRRKRND